MPVVSCSLSVVRCQLYTYVEKISNVSDRLMPLYYPFNLGNVILYTTDNRQL